MCVYVYTCIHAHLNLHLCRIYIPTRGARNPAARASTTLLRKLARARAPRRAKAAYGLAAFILPSSATGRESDSGLRDSLHPSYSLCRVNTRAVCISRYSRARLAGTLYPPWQTRELSLSLTFPLTCGCVIRFRCVCRRRVILVCARRMVL